MDLAPEAVISSAWISGSARRRALGAELDGLRALGLHRGVTSDGGRIAYYGFRYQIDASIWVALEGLFKRALSGVAELETDSDEDVALLLGTAGSPTNERVVRTGLRTDTQRWLFAIKTRRTGHWTYSELRESFSGPTKASERLGRVYPRAILAADANARFVFLTEGSLADGLSALIAEPQTWEPAGGGTREDLKDLYEDSARISFLGQLSHESLRLQTERLLAKSLGIPSSEVSEAFTKLRSRAELAIVDRASAVVTRDELVAIAKECGGWPTAERPELFVEPSNWSSLIDRLQRSHRVLVVGEPGTGKSEAAQELARELRTGTQPFVLVKADDPREVPVASSGERIVVWADDPFGRVTQCTLERRAAWLKAFSNAKVSADYKLIVNARSSFVGDIGKHELRDALVSLDSAFADRRGEVLDRHLAMTELHPDVADVVGVRRAEILHMLARPESYRLFARRAAELVKLDHSGLDKLLRECAAADLASDLAGYLQGQPLTVQRGAYVLAWLLSVGERSRDLRTRARRAQTAIEAAKVGEVDVESALRQLEKRGWLARRAGYGDLALRDGQIGACLELVEGDMATARRVAAALRDAWALEGNAAAVRTLLTSVAVELTDTEDVLSILDQGLAAQPLTGRGLAIYHWQRPRWTRETRRRIQTDERTRPYLSGVVAQGFLLEWLSASDQIKLADFVMELAHLGGAFADAGRERFLGYDRNRGLAAIAHGYVRTQAAPELAVEDAIARLRQVNSEWLPIDDEDNIAATEHAGEIWHSETEWPRLILQSALRHLQLDWATHRTETEVWEAVAELLRPAQGFDAPSEVLQRLALCCPLDDLVDLFGALVERADVTAAAAALGRVRPRDLRDALRARIFRERGVDAVSEAAMVDTLRARALSAKATERIIISRAIEDFTGTSPVALSADEANTVAVLRDPESIKRLATETAATALLEEIARSDHGLESARATVALSWIDNAWHAVLRRFFTDADTRAAVWVMEAAAPQDLTEETLRLGLAHRRAAVRKPALAAAAFCEALRPQVAELARRDPTPSVRVAAARALSVIRDDLAFDTLTDLLADTTDTSEDARHGNAWEEGAEFGIANAAREILGDRGWPPRHG